MKVVINDKTFQAEVMDTQEKIQTGMMGRKSIDGCMVFNLKNGHHSFWMKNCLIPLDIVFVQKNRVSGIHKNCMPCGDECEKRYTGIGNRVVEFPSGTSSDWKVGDKINFIN